MNAVQAQTWRTVLDGFYVSNDTAIVPWGTNQMLFQCDFAIVPTPECLTHGQANMDSAPSSHAFGFH